MKVGIGWKQLSYCPIAGRYEQCNQTSCSLKAGNSLNSKHLIYDVVKYNKCKVVPCTP